VDAAKDVPVELNKYVAYYHSMADPGKRMLVAAKRDLQEARGVGVDRLRAEQKMYLSDFWQRSDVIIEGDPEIQQGIRFNLFHLLQAAGQNGRTNVPAKGLTGEGYDGHYFWDTEIYSLPFFIYTNPIIARRLLQYRYSILDAARERARELSHRGALFPWRTVLGEEASAYFPAGTAQYHIDADIVYAIRKYVEASGDFAFMLQYGAEICFETARFWTDLGDYIDGKGFCLNEVTGPNEYTTLINNNVFTNLMAQDNLRFAVSVAKTLERDYPSAYSRIAQKVDLEESERGDWARAADEMFVPIDRTRLIYPQDDSFFEKARWDFKSTPGDHYPLLLNYHPLIIYRHQVLKQPDLVLALFLQGGKFTYEDKLRNFHYYDPLTTGDSSLSPCVQSIVAAEIGETELALEYFMRTARMDLDDVNGNVHHGVHVANLAGTWMSLVYGFAGMRDESGSLSFRPRLPERWSRLRFRLHRHEAFFEVDIHRSSVAYRLLEGRPFRLTHFDESLVLGDPEKTLVLEIPQSRRPE
jgi:alpha,alpha-trehalose phosphorylase